MAPRHGRAWRRNCGYTFRRPRAGSSACFRVTRRPRTFQHAYPLFGRRIRAFMPPQGLLVVAAYLPERWQIRFIDENIAAALAADFRWADAVLVSGMHVQRGQIEDIIRRASSSRARVLHA